MAIAGEGARPTKLVTRLVKVVKDKSSFKILTPPSVLKRQLLNIEMAGRTCYQSETGKITEKSAGNFVRMLIQRGHESVIEHSFMTVRFNNVSRGFTHEMVRHRLASFSQESTRYVDYAKGTTGSEIDLDAFQIKCIVPPHRNESEKVPLEDGTTISLKEMYTNIEQYYRALRKAGWKPEDARQVLPIGLNAQIVVTCNFREWRHIFTMRTSKAAHWEIRGIMCKLLRKMQDLVPAVFDDFVYGGKDDNGVEYFEKTTLK